MKKYLFAVTVTSSLFASSVFAQEMTSNAKPEFDRHKPGHEQRFEKRMEKLVEACADKNTQEPCTVQMGERELTGTCIENKRDQKMACRIDRPDFEKRDGDKKMHHHMKEPEAA